MDANNEGINMDLYAKWKPTTLCPIYLHKEYESYQKKEEDRTTYTEMNEWRDRPLGNTVGGAAPVAGSKWYQDKMTEAAKPLGQRSVDEFNKAYSNLTKQIAYLHPNPGLPRCREGRIGGTWRHIKEVLGHSGNRVVFVDGLVSIYDSENFSNRLQQEGPYRPHLASARYAPTRDDLQSYNRRELSDLQTSGYRPSFPEQSVEFPSYQRDPEIQRKLDMQRPNKYKGFNQH